MQHLISSLKTLVMGAALAAAIDTTAAKCFECSSQDMFHFDGTQYTPVGDYGWDFYCNGTEGTCVYYRPDPVFSPNYYVPCKDGNYTPIS